MILIIQNANGEKAEWDETRFVGDAAFVQLITLFYAMMPIGSDFGAWAQELGGPWKVEYIPDEIPEGIVE